MDTNTQPKAGDVAEYGDIDSGDMSKRTILKEGPALRLKTTIQLYKASPGWKLAGSCAVYTNGGYGVQFELDGATHGQSGLSEQDARIRFDNMTSQPLA